jgi:hypothetical protein
MIDLLVWEAVGQEFVCPGNNASHLAKLLLVPVLDVWGHNLLSYQLSFPYLNSHLDQDYFWHPAQ